MQFWTSLVTRRGQRSLQRSRVVLAVQTFPNAREEGLLASKLHLGTLFVVRRAKPLQIFLDIGRTLPAAHHVVVKDIQRFGGIRKRLDARREEATRAVSAKAMAAG